MDAGLVAERGRRCATCRRPSATSTIRSPTIGPSATPAPTATRPATPSRRPSCRASWNWSSATASPCGGTTASAGPASIWTASASRTWTELQAFLRRHQRDLWVLDLTSDLGIPVFAAVSRRTDGGSRADPVRLRRPPRRPVALLRAVTELNQMLGPLLNVPADDLAGQPPDGQRHASLAANRDGGQSAVSAAAGRATADAPSYYPACRSDDLKDDVLFCQALVERHGMEMLVLDQTRRRSVCRWSR